MSSYTREKIKLPQSIKPKDRVKIADVLISHIVSRSLAGYDKNDKKFVKYTKGYADTKGVKRTDVDLTLSGEMLDSLELVSHKSGEIVIGYKDPSDELAGKVEGNRIGSYGGEPDKNKARDFLGIDPSDLDVLISSYDDSNDTNDRPLSDDEIDQVARDAAREIFGDIQFNE